MYDPAQDPALLELASLVHRLNTDTEEINDQLRLTEISLVEMNAGLTVFTEPLYMRVPPDSKNGSGADFGFGKFQDEWGLWIRRGKFEKTSAGDWKPVAGDIAVLPVLGASREERAAAVEFLPSLIERMKEAVEARISSMEAARARAAKKVGR
jgi:hypothetical protein